MKTLGHDYFLCVARSLGACQLVELELKLYVAQAFELVKKCVAGRLPFEMAGSDYDNASLERLIEIFKKLSANEALVKRLTTFKEGRNFVAHKAIAACLDPDGNVDYLSEIGFKGRLTEIENEAALLTTAIHEEAMKFVAHLYLDVEKTSD